MRVKNLMVMVAESVLAVSFSHAAPSSSVRLAADDMPMDNSQNATNNAMSNPGAMSGVSNGTPTESTPAVSGTGSSDAASSGNGVDGGTSDTATGSSDDSSDY